MLKLNKDNRNPKLDFLRIVYFVLTLFLTLNKVDYKLDVHWKLFEFQIESKEISSGLNILLLVIAVLSLILHFFKITGKRKGVLFINNRNKVGNISGNNISINQEIGSKE